MSDQKAAVQYIEEFYSAIDFVREYSSQIPSESARPKDEAVSTAGTSSDRTESGINIGLQMRRERYYSRLLPHRPRTVCADAHPSLLRSLLFPVVGKFPLHGPDPSFVLPLTGKPDASDTKTQIGRE